jgi:glycosyltransferase involved in cell wall biosynthesis
MLRNKSLIRLSRWLEEFLYKHSSLITGQTQNIVNNIRSRFSDKPVALMTNGVDAKAFFHALKPDQKAEIRAEFGFGDQFVIGYAGLHGLAQGLETVIHAARLVADHENLLFVFFGDGPEKEQLVELAHQFKLNNVRFYASQPTMRMPAIVASFDLALVPLKRLEIFRGALPSKMFEAMAAGVPILVSIDGEARAVVEKSQAGISIEPENPQAMANAILELYRNREHLKMLGFNGQRYVIEHYDREKIAREFERLLYKVRWPEATTA